MSEGGEEWISASAARAMGAPGTDFADAIIERAKVGLVKARARLLVWDREGQKTKQCDCDIPQDFWRNGVETDHWDQGDFGVLWNLSSTSWMAGPDAADSFAYGVTFARADIEAMLPERGKIAIPLALENRSKGGSPGKYDWARAVGIVVFQWADSGTWQPKSKGEVQAKLAEWFNQQSQTPDDKLLKHYARWLFEEFEKRKSAEEKQP